MGDTCAQYRLANLHQDFESDLEMFAVLYIGRRKQQIKESARHKLFLPVFATQIFVGCFLRSNENNGFRLNLSAAFQGVVIKGKMNLSRHYFKLMDEERVSVEP
jgi:hypothetical protein